MSRGGKVLVAGAGALGLSAALTLADAGCEVVVCDPAEPRASGVAAGMLAPAFEAVLEPQGARDFDLLLAARNLWPGLEARAGVALDRSGAVAVGDDAWLDRIGAGLVRLGLHGTELGRPTLEDLVPELSPASERGLLVREDWRLEPPAALNALRAAAEASGVAFRNERVSGRGGADVLVIATGHERGLAELAPELALLTPIKGQILHYPSRQARRVSLRAAGAYAVPNADGFSVGATMEHGRDDVLTEASAWAPLAAAAARLFPATAGVEFAVAAGVRGATPDGLPMAGFSAEPGVVLAVGARRNGWLLAPLIARVVAACVTQGDAGPYAERLDPRRFEAARGA